MGRWSRRREERGSVVEGEMGSAEDNCFCSVLLLYLCYGRGEWGIMQMIGLCCSGFFCMMILRGAVEERSCDREGGFVLYWHFEGGRVGDPWTWDVSIDVRGITGRRYKSLPSMGGEEHYGSKQTFKKSKKDTTEGLKRMTGT